MRSRRNVYQVIEQVAILIIGFSLLAVAAALLPSRADAFWPFSTNADAATAAAIPSPLTPALMASMNPNPNSSAPISLSTSLDSALVPYSGPDGSLAEVASTTPDRISVYVVRPGDSLSDISKMFGVSVNTIVWANSLGSSRSVRPGDTLIILPVSGVEHKVAKGDTLKSLAKKYSANADEIAEFNDLDPKAALAIGSTLIVPGGEIAAPTPASKARNIKEPYLGGSGPALAGFFAHPLPGAALTQALHGWNGVDFGAPRGTSIRAAADGTVIIVRNSGWNGGYGNYVVISHTNGTQTLYSHMTRAVVATGQGVGAGQLIGYVGNTGLSTGSHLHFEVRGAANPFRTCPVGRVCQPQ